VSAAFVEDPVRILRVARFAARFGFAVAPETMALMRSMVAEGETGALVPERVWQEFSRGLMEGDPAPMFAVLAEAGLLAQLLPELGLAFENGLAANDAARILVRSLECAAAERLVLAPRFALLALCARSPEAVSALAERLRPRETAAISRCSPSATPARCFARLRSAPPRASSCSSAATPSGGPSASTRCWPYSPAPSAGGAVGARFPSRRAWLAGR